METLVALPPLRQSMVETASCPRAYVSIVIEGNAQPDSIPSERGQEIHHVMSEYVSHCAALSISSDWNYFNKLAVAAGPVAGPILDSLRDNYQVNWKEVYGTEVKLRLTEDFKPCAPPVAMNVESYRLHEEDAAYEGTLDVIEISYDGMTAKVVDYKSHPAVFDADTFQSMLYPFMLLKHLPNLRSVTFELVFVRYANCVRSVVWKREDMPEMQAAISRARERQRITHERPEEAKALPCTVCTYCPLAKNLTCPISQWNEYTALTPPLRLQWKEWLRRMAAINTPILKAFAEVNGTVRYQDGNGKTYEYGEMPVPTTRFPLDRTTIQALEDHLIGTGEDLLDGKLSIISTTIKPTLKAKKRAALMEIFEESIIETSTKPKFAVRTPDEGIVKEYDPYTEE